ncbi:MAG: YtxH domain-containing protein [Anaerolineales bacterium]|jgi:gas vesicle protein|nr:YtxH domain-containing protein [Anaerolineales bacterium]
MSERDEFGAFLVGFIVGGLAGAMTALLLAPQSGEETRAVIKERSIELRDRAAAEAEEAWKRAEEAAQEAREKAEKFAKETREKADDLAQQALAQGEEITLKVSEKGKELADSAKKAVNRVKKSDGPELPAKA